MPHLVMPLFYSSKVETPFVSTTKFNTQQNEEQNEGGQMEVNSVVALKFHLVELEVTSDIGNILNIANPSDTTRWFKNVENHVPTKVNVPHIDSIALTFFNATVNVDSKVIMVGTNMDTKDVTFVQPYIATNLVNILPNISTTPKSVGLNIGVVL